MGGGGGDYKLKLARDGKRKKKALHAYSSRKKKALHSNGKRKKKAQLRLDVDRAVQIVDRQWNKISVTCQVSDTHSHM
jgi:hypothetical protein